MTKKKLKEYYDYFKNLKEEKKRFEKNYLIVKDSFLLFKQCLKDPSFIEKLENFIADWQSLEESLFNSGNKLQEIESKYYEQLQMKEKNLGIELECHFI